MATYNALGLRLRFFDFPNAIEKKSRFSSSSGSSDAIDFALGTGIRFATGEAVVMPELNEIVKCDDQMMNYKMTGPNLSSV